jgi:hypothetical protein
LSAVRTIRYHNSAEPQIPPQGEHSILTVAPHSIRPAYTELFDRQKLSHSQLYIRSHHHPPLGSQQPHVLQLTPPRQKLTVRAAAAHLRAKCSHSQSEQRSHRQDISLPFASLTRTHSKLKPAREPVGSSAEIFATSGLALQQLHS